ARALRREAVDLETAFAHLSAVIKPLAESAEVTVKVDGVEPWPQFQGDSDLIAGALLNLLSNAVKYSPRGGEVQMRVWEEPDQVIIEVSNAGPVIPQQEIPRLFEPYFRRGEHEHGVRGWGLGLAFVKRVAEGHGGRVEASSDATVGTRFRLVFPNLRP
ncbi:MAG TPA: sensor histidine kinase, partial [Terriglobia bacterium]|nr:sensor histidine kinase [Terriglobia bacterium]